MPERSKPNHTLVLVIVALLAWAIPGAGHFCIKERKRAVIIFITITAIFLIGLYVGSVAVVDSVGNWPWYAGQVMTTPAVAIIAHITKTGDYISLGKGFDVGQIYTTIAGMLNLLCIISAVYMAHSGYGEFVGEDEDDQ